jgi:hypothetical protein
MRCGRISRYGSCLQHIHPYVNQTRRRKVKTLFARSLALKAISAELGFSCLALASPIPDMTRHILPAGRHKTSVELAGNPWVYSAHRFHCTGRVRATVEIDLTRNGS